MVNSYDKKTNQKTNKQMAQKYQQLSLGVKARKGGKPLGSLSFLQSK